MLSVFVNKKKSRNSDSIFEKFLKFFGYQENTNNFVLCLVLKN